MGSMEESGVFFNFSGIVVVFAALLALAGVAYLLYYFFYLKRVNRALKKAGHNWPIAEPRLAAKVILGIGAAACVLGLLFWTWRLQDRLDDMVESEESLRYEVANLRTEAERRHQELLEEIRAGNSQFSNCSYHVQKADIPGKELTVRLTAVPKELSETAEASLSVGGQTGPLDWNGGGFFEGSFPLDPFGPLEQEAVLSVTDGGVTRSEAVRIDLSDWRGSYFPEVWTYWENYELTTLDNNQIALDCVASVHVSYERASSLRSMKFVVRQDGSVLREESCFSQLMQGYEASVDCGGQYERGKDTLLLLQFEDGHGYIHERCLLNILPDGTVSEGFQGEWLYDEAYNFLGILSD